MTRELHVIAHSGHRGEQEPRALVVDGERMEIVAIEDRWYDPDASYFRVRLADGEKYLLRLGLDDMSWSATHSAGAVIKGPW